MHARVFVVAQCHDECLQDMLVHLTMFKASSITVLGSAYGMVPCTACGTYA